MLMHVDTHQPSRHPKLDRIFARLSLLQCGATSAVLKLDRTGFELSRILGKASYNAEGWFLPMSILERCRSARYRTMCRVCFPTMVKSSGEAGTLRS
jgi:hypothetical protein